MTCSVMHSERNNVKSFYLRIEFIFCKINVFKQSLLKPSNLRTRREPSRIKSLHLVKPEQNRTISPSLQNVSSCKFWLLSLIDWSPSVINYNSINRCSPNQHTKYERLQNSFCKAMKLSFSVSFAFSKRRNCRKKLSIKDYSWSVRGNSISF